MSKSISWKDPVQWRERGHHEKAFLYDGMARWDAIWHTLSPEARWAFVKEVKIPQRTYGPKQDQPSARADRFAANVLEELRKAGLIEVFHSAKGNSLDLVFGLLDAIDFMMRLRALDRHHPLRSELPGMLVNYAAYAFHQQTAAQALNVVLRHAGFSDYENFESILRVYVVNHRWSDWVTRSLKNPVAEQIVNVLRDANGPVLRTDLQKKLPKIAADKLESTIVTLIAYLVAFEDLDPQTGELLVGLLPAVHASRTSSLQHRERPPLVVSDPHASVLPEGSILVDDLRTFLLEIVAEPPRLRQDDEIFQKDQDRFLSAPVELPVALSHALELNKEIRLQQAQDWARHLKLVGKRSQAKQARLEISVRGNKWLTASLLEQHRQVYEFLQPHDFGKAESRANTIPDMNPYAVYGSQEADLQFLGANAIAIRTRAGYAEHYWTAKPDDHKALRDSLDRSLSALQIGVYYRLESVLDHLAFGQFNPLSLGLPFESVAVFLNGRSVPPIPEARDEAARDLLTMFLRKRLLPLGCFQAAIDAEGHLCIARHQIFDMYFGRKVDDEVLSGTSRSQSRVVVQPDFSIVVIGLNPAPAAELIGFCERERRGGHGALTLRLTRESVVKAVAYGMRPEEIVNRLRRLASNDLPPNVLREVTEWGGWVRSVRASTRMLLHCPDSETADRIMAAMKRQAERLTETIVAVDQLKLTTADRNKLRDQGVLIEGKET